MATSSTSNGRRTRQRRQNRRSQSSSSVVNVDDYNADSSGTCIDLTADVSGYDVIDLTRGHNISLMDSPVVVLNSADDFGPVRRRGSGRRGRHRSNTRRHLSSSLGNLSTPNNPSQPFVHVLPSEDSDSDDISEPQFHMGQSSTGVNNSVLRSPEGVKIFCPICMDDTKQILRNGRQVMSTICGHIFCDTCIKAAINTQHACPTCRKKLYQRSIHQLFL